MAKPQGIFTVTTLFVNDPRADVVLISSDNYNFRVRKALLSLASSVFYDMFSFPQLVNESHDDLPSVLLTETGQVIDAILRHCYPRHIVIPPASDFSLLAQVLEAAEKYDMSQVISVVELSIQELRFSQPEALLFLYRRACDQRQDFLARGYAWDCLKISQSSIVAHWGTNSMMDYLPNLINYHQAVSVKVGERVIDFDWPKELLEIPYSVYETLPPPPPPPHGVRGSDCDYPRWYTIVAYICALQIQKEGPLSDKILPSGGEEAWRHRLHNKPEGVIGQAEFRKKFYKDLETKAKEVRFHLPW